MKSEVTIRKYELNGAELLDLALERFGGNVSYRYNRQLEGPMRMILRLESDDEIIEFQTDDFAWGGTCDNRVKYGDGSGRNCNGRNEKCAKMVGRVQLYADSYVTGTFRELSK